MSDFTIHVILLVVALCLTLNAAIHHRLLGMIIRRMAAQDELVGTLTSGMKLTADVMKSQDQRIKELKEQIDG